MTLVEFLVVQNRPTLLWNLVYLDLLPIEALECISKKNHELPTILMQICDKGWWRLVRHVFPLVSIDNVNL